MNCLISLCREDPGTHIICAMHRKGYRHMSQYMKDKIMKAWHGAVCMKGYDAEKDQYICYHCGYFFSRDAVCGDHFPKSKGADPANKFNIDSGVCCCMNCNRSDNPTRKHNVT